MKHTRKQCEATDNAPSAASKELTAADAVVSGSAPIPASGTESRKREATINGDPTEFQEEKQWDAALRPRMLCDVIGQKAVVDRLKIMIKAHNKSKEPLSHILFDGPPGLGKTTFATILSKELNQSIQMTSGPALTKPKDMIPFLTNAEEGSIIFIDEIHRMPRAVEEFIYPAMEDFRIDIILGEGINARTITMKLKPFALVGATTRSGMLSGPMRDRFKMHEHLEFYTDEELAEIVKRNARKLRTKIAPDAARELARRSRGTPRIANARLWWARNYSISEGDGSISLQIAQEALKMADVDDAGLDKQDRRYLETLLDVFSGGPTGVEALAATMNLPADTLSDEIEPYLLREQFIIRTPRGRVAAVRAQGHLGRGPRGDVQTLFD